ncbi:bifunctional nuclease family protein [Candidatus Poribacteria bacterium]|nr:bifunctional nuclease family protein [Candidatus Poribacteria bacterium]
MMISDDALVQCCKDGDREAFNTLIKRYQHAVYGLCYHFAGDFADAQDLAQETFVRVYLDLHQIQNVSKFPAWLRQVTTRVCQMWLRRQKRELQTSIDEATESDLIDPQASSPAEEAVTNEMRGFVARAISQLSEEYRLAVTMYYIDGLSYREIGEFLDVPQTTIKNRLHRARQQLKKELLKMVEKEFETQRLSDEFSEQVLQEVEIAHVIRGETALFLFSIELREHPINLDDSQSLTDLRQLFEANGSVLSQALSVGKEADNRWLVTDEGNQRTYAVRKEEDKLKVYDRGPKQDAPVLVLKLKDNPQQRLPIWIGEPEAWAISIGMKGDTPPRPMTHDLLLNLLQAANAKIQQIIVSDIREQTFIGKMVIDFNGTVKEIDCRPSDAIAIAVRANLPILVAKKLTEQESLWKSQDDSEKVRKEVVGKR